MFRDALALARFLLAAGILSLGASCESSEADALPTGGGGPDATATGDGGADATVPADADAATGADASGPCGEAAQACCADFACQGGLVCDGATCGGAVAPFACPAGAPEAVFVGEALPAGKLAPWARPFASVTFANCGSSTWSTVAIGSPTGVKIGPSAPHDLETWTPARLALPADVPPAHRVTIVLPIHVPPLTGPLAYAFQVVREGVAWLGQPSPTHMLDVQADAAPAVALCNGVTADASGGLDARAALQTCIDQTASGGTLALPPGIFRIGGVVTIAKPMTLTSAGASGVDASCLSYDAPRCAVLRADASVSPSASSTRGFVRLGLDAAPTSQVTLDHILVDGNRGERLASPAAAACASGNNGDGINIGARCTSCTVRGSASVRALCGTGLEWDGDGVTVERSVFFANGEHTKQNMWADGLTIHKSDGATVDHCRFVDNSDVGFISGGGVGAHYTNNVAAQLSQASFAAIMLDNFNNGAIGDFSGATLTGNTIVCPAICHFGIELGPRPWYASPNIKGGSVTGNSVRGAYIQINAQGAGVVGAPTVISGNDLGPTPASAAFLCGTVSGLSPLNVSPESVVDLQGGVATGSISVPCP